MMVYQSRRAHGGASPVEEADAGRRAASAKARLRRWVEHFAFPRHALVNARANRRAGDDLAGAFANLGYAVQLQGRFRNVLALPRGARGLPLTLVAAHYDSVPGSPGADDNASGLAAMLECARALAGSEALSAVGFIAFNAEEDGLLGSRDFVAEGLRDLPGPLGAVHVLEMVGFRGPPSGEQPLPLPWVPKGLRSPDFLALLTRGPSNESAQRALAHARSGGPRVVAAKTWAPIERLLPDLLRSDHAPFWAAGLPATLWTDTGNFRNPNYHRISDTPETLDYAFLLEVTALLCVIASGGRASLLD
jgi:Peptidase family M28